jgi:hypothetical protein
MDGQYSCILNVLVVHQTIVYWSLLPDIQLKQSEYAIHAVIREIHRLFEAKRDTIKAELRNALTAVHISFDLWTSPNRFAIMAVFAHFIDQLGYQ